jgi:hypothetical protein
VRKARNTMQRVSMGLLKDAREALDSGIKEEGRRDLLSLLLRSNMSKDISENYRLSEAVIAARMYLLRVVPSHLSDPPPRAPHILRRRARDD